MGKRANSYKHGHRYGKYGKPSNVYGSWQSMKVRVKNVNKSGGHYFGMEMEPDWENFEAFLKDLGEPVDRHYTLDRIDNTKGYIRGNVRWSDKGQQARNRYNNILVEGVVLKDWCTSKGFRYKTVHRWLVKEGKDFKHINERGNELWGKEQNKIS